MKRFFLSYAFFALVIDLGTLLAVRHSKVAADDVSNTWTGSVEARGNYYLEKSTRVMAPALRARFEAPIGVTFQADYLVDAISSASIAAGAATDVVFTEVRHDVGLAASIETLIENRPVRWGVYGRLSYEPDYFSRGCGLTTTTFFNRRATSLTVGLNYTDDNVGRKLRGVPSGSTQLTTTREHVGALRGLVVNTSFLHALLPTLEIGAGYDLGLARGFLANPYRIVTVNGVPRAESHPEQRLRHSVFLQAQWFIPSLNTGLHLIPRFYTDSWDIVAFAPELRLYHEFDAHWLVRLQARYYHQSAAYFNKAVPDYQAEDMFVTADPKMTSFTNMLLGVQTVLKLSLFKGTMLDFIRDASWDFNVAHIWNSNRFGNGLIAQSGLIYPF